MISILVKQAIPNSLGFLVGKLQENISMVFIGRLNKPELLAGVGIGSLAVNMLMTTVVIGLNSALDTLVS